MPTGSVELVIDLHEDEIPLFDFHSHAQQGSTKGVRICGVHSRSFIFAKRQRCSVMGVHFKPRGNAALLAFPAGELHNQIVSLEDLWQEDVKELRDQLRSYTTIEIRFQILEQFLFRKMRLQNHHSAVDFALREFERSPNSPVSRVVNHKIGLSTRHFNQIFRDYVGLTPKLYCRVRRLQRVLCLLEGQTQIDWLTIALTCGYFDQAHLIHDFRTFAGCTPTEYVAKRGFLPFHIELSN